ncbi:MAG: hypothetical protein NTW16_00675 [Bacteroidetes bacterium]|nr:hypothetical protein [Bacteroidota bacterium]
MALNNLQIKVYPETEQDFNTLMAESDSSTKGKFLELLIENYKNPKVKNVFQDTPETRKRIEELENEVEELLRERDHNANTDAMTSNELSIYRQSFNEMKTVFAPYLEICKRDNLAQDYNSMFSLMLKILQSIPVKGPRLFVLTPEDIQYLKNQPAE